MTASQIMMKLREIEAELNQGDIGSAQITLGSLIEWMLADEARAKSAHTMGELPFDGQGKMK